MFFLVLHNMPYHWGQVLDRAFLIIGNQHWQHRWSSFWWYCWMVQWALIISPRRLGRINSLSIWCLIVSMKRCLRLALPHRWSWPVGSSSRTDLKAHMIMSWWILLAVWFRSFAGSHYPSFNRGVSRQRRSYRGWILPGRLWSSSRGRWLACKGRWRRVLHYCFFWRLRRGWDRCACGSRRGYYLCS